MEGDLDHSRGKPVPNMSKKREGYLEWPEYFMAIAFLSAQRSKDPRTQVGACVVNKENKIVGIGYNGMPNGCHDDMMPWGREGDDVLNKKHLYVCHAELNAILNKNSADVKDCTIYVTLFPCNECAKVVIQSGIREVVYYSDKYHEKVEFQASRRLLEIAGIKYRQYRPERKQVVIDFTSIDNPTNNNIEDLKKLSPDEPTNNNIEDLKKLSPDEPTNNNIEDLKKLSPDEPTNNNIEDLKKLSLDDPTAQS